VAFFILLYGFRFFKSVYLTLMNRLKFAIIGCGKIAPRHAAEIVKWGELSAVCDIVPEKADALAKEFNCRAYYTVAGLLASEKNIDLAAVCTPNGLHATHAIQCLLQDWHVLCEKPLSLSATDARRMIETAETHHRKLFVVKSTRYNPALAALKKMITNNELGRIYSFQLNGFWNRPAAYYEGTWHGTELDGGTLFTQFSHYIDALLWLLGGIRQVKGFRKNMVHKNLLLAEDCGVVSVEMENGVLGGINWSVNTFRENLEVSLTLIAEKGTVKLGGPYMNQVEYQLTDGAGIPVTETGAANDYGFYKGSMSNHDKVYENLVKAFEDSTHPFASAEDGLKTVEAIEKIYHTVLLS
jgi:predicted dehydrogenase